MVSGPMTKTANFCWNDHSTWRCVPHAMLCNLLLVSTSFSIPTPSQPPEFVPALGTWSGIDLRTKKFTHVKTPGIAKLRVALFLSPHCPVARSHLAHLEQLGRGLANKVEFIAFHSSPSEMDADSLNSYGDMRLPFPVLQDTEQKVAKKFKIQQLPHGILFDATGKIIYQGAVSNARDFSQSTRWYLNDAIKAAIRGDDPDLDRASAAGCPL